MAICFDEVPITNYDLNHGPRVKTPHRTVPRVETGCLVAARKRLRRGRWIAWEFAKEAAPVLDPLPFQTTIKAAVDRLGVHEVARRLEISGFTVAGLCYGISVKQTSRETAEKNLHKLEVR